MRRRLSGNAGWDVDIGTTDVGSSDGKDSVGATPMGSLPSDGAEPVSGCETKRYTSATPQRTATLMKIEKTKVRLPVCISRRKQDMADPVEEATQESAIATQQARSAGSVSHAVEVRVPRPIT